MISVIIATYQAEPWIRTCLDSVFASDIPVAVYIVDNASTDTTVSILQKEYGNRIFLHCSKENLGFGKANNIALKQAYLDGCEYFFLLNQDARVATDTLSLLSAAFRGLKGYGILSPLHFNGEGNDFDFGFDKYLKHGNKAWYDAIRENTQLDLIRPLPFMNAAGWMVNRNCIDKIGLFNPVFFHYGEDNNFVQRLNYHGLHLGLFPKAQIWHHRKQNTEPESRDFLNKRFLRFTLLELSNPYNSITKYQVLKIYGKQGLLALTAGKITIAKENFRKIYMLKQINGYRINYFRKISRIPGKCFFDQTPSFFAK